MEYVNPNRCEYEGLLQPTRNFIGGHTPVPCAIDEMLTYVKIEDLADERTWTAVNENIKVAYPKHVTHIWDGERWSRVQFVIKHSPKELIKINTHIGCIDCALDHRLVSKTGEIEASNVDVSGNVDTLLFHSEPPLPLDTPNKPKYRDIDNDTVLSHNLSTDAEKLLFIYGVFFACGTAGTYKNGNTITFRKSWCIYSADKELLEKVAEYLNNFETGCRFEIKFFPESNSTTYYLRPHSIGPRGSVKNLANKYRQMFYDNRKNKIVPAVIFNTSLIMREAFLVGFCSSRAASLEVGILTHEVGQIGAAGLFRLFRSLGYAVSVTFTPSSNYRIRSSEKLRSSEPEKIKLIDKLFTVPDIEVPVMEQEKRGVKQDKDGIYHYKGIKIIAERFPREKLLLSLDKAQEKNKFRGRFIKFEKKKVTYKCDNCNVVSITCLDILHGDKKPGYNKVCKCPEELRYNENYVPLQQNPDNEPKEDLSKDVYTLQTETSKYVAGVGMIIIHS